MAAEDAESGPATDRGLFQHNREWLSQARMTLVVRLILSGQQSEPMVVCLSMSKRWCSIEAKPCRLQSSLMLMSEIVDAQSAQGGLK